MGHCASISDGQGKKICLEHMYTLLEQMLKVCTNLSQEQQSWQMLTTYADVFNIDKAYVGRMTLLEHRILVYQSTAPIPQPPQTLSIENDQEMEDQVQQLMNQMLVEPGKKVWSSPVVRVQKKD